LVRQVKRFRADWNVNSERIIAEFCKSKKISFSDFMNICVKKFVRKLPDSEKEYFKILRRENKEMRRQLYFFTNTVRNIYNLAQSDMHTFGCIDWATIQFISKRAYMEEKYFYPETKRLLSKKLRIFKQIIKSKNDKKLLPLLHRIIFEDVSGIEEYDPRGGR
jgi:hypothetical protein